MNKKVLVATAVISILTISVFVYLTTRKSFSNMQIPSQGIQDLTGDDDISRLEHGVLVRFPATLVKRQADDCIELFTKDDFAKYHGDSKWAVSARFANAPFWFDWFGENGDVVVTGKMVFVRDAEDASATCGIITGDIFEIAQIEYRR